MQVLGGWGKPQSLTVCNTVALCAETHNALLSLKLQAITSLAVKRQPKTESRMD